MTQYTREYMEQKLRERHPHWNRQTIAGWSYQQLQQIYLKEARKCVASTLANLNYQSH